MPGAGWQCTEQSSEGVLLSDGGGELRVVVVGDVGRPNFYHTGDEAMTEAAVDQLRDRGVDDVVLVASSPDLATETYGCPAVPRIRFSKDWSRERCDRRLAELDTLLGAADPTTGAHGGAISAVAGADALLIAGGGNLRSEHRYMIYERLALVRVAKHFGKPVFITSQTVGPMLEPGDEGLVREIASSASCFGAREASTAELVGGLVGDAVRVQVTMDDSVLLGPRPEDVEHLATLALPKRYIVASFTYHAGSTGMSRRQYCSYLAETMDALAQHLDADVLLVPHCGAFDPELVTFDRANDAAVVEASTSGRLRALPLLTARQVIALTSGAVLSVSTRYHATVFGTSQGVPSIGLVTSHYSLVRMAGSLGNVGLGQFAIPAHSRSVPVVIAAVDELASRDVEIRGYLRQVSDLRRTDQSAWWDAMVAAMRDKSDVPSLTRSELPQYRSGDWELRVQDVLPFADQSWSRHAELKRARTELASARDEIATLQEKLASTRQELGLARSRLNRIMRHPAARLVKRLRGLVRR